MTNSYQLTIPSTLSKPVKVDLVAALATIKIKNEKDLVETVVAVTRKFYKSAIT